MSKQFIQMTSGWIPVAVMALLAVALIAGQARATLPNEYKAVPFFAATMPVNIVLSSPLLKRSNSLPALVEHVLAMPGDIEFRIDTRILRGDVSHEKVSPLKSK